MSAILLRPQYVNTEGIIMGLHHYGFSGKYRLINNDDLLNDQEFLPLRLLEFHFKS